MHVRECQGRRSRVAGRVEEHGSGADSIDVPAIAPVEGADPETEPILNNRGTEGFTDLVARIAPVGKGNLGTGVIGRLGQIGLRLDEAQRAALRSGSEQGPLWAAQHFDALQVKEGGEGGT